MGVLIIFFILKYKSLFHIVIFISNLKHYSIMTNPSCYYHPSREAMDKCESCGKLICVECKNVYRYRRSSGTSDHRRYYYMSQELCTPCFCDANIKGAKMTKYQPFLMLIPIVFMGIMFMFISGNIGSMGVLSNILPMMILPVFIVLIPFGIIFLVLLRNSLLSPKKEAEFNMRKQEFFNNISVPSGAPASVPVHSSAPAYCKQCGSNLDPDEKFCSQCGSET